MEIVRKITAPEGCEIEKVEIVDGAAVITFKKKERKLPKSWEQFCEMFPMKLPYNFAVQRHDLYSDDFMFLQSYNNRLIEEMEKFTGDRATAEAVLAMCQLIQLRNCYNGGWVPDWTDKNRKYTIDFDEGKLWKGDVSESAEILAFKTKELCNEFMRNFRPLIEKLKPLYGIKKGGKK